MEVYSKENYKSIRLVVALAVKYTMLNKTTPKEMWKKLEEIYALKSLTNCLCLEIDLYTFRMERDNLHAHINEFVNC